MSKRFRIAFSFAGDQHRGFVAEVATLLAARFHQDNILFDEFHEAEFAHPNLAFALPALYKKEADLVVAVFCPNYEHKDWCRLEWRAIYSIIKEGGEKQIMLGRFEFTDGEGLHGLAGFIELDHKTPEQFATLILERLALNEGKPRDHYQLAASSSSFDIRHSSPPVPSNLPGGYIGRVFVGRDDFLDQLRASLEKQKHATAITQATAATGISGLGGMGKTHAAVEYAHRHQSDYTALLFVCGHSPERLSASIAALCDVLQLNTQCDLPSDESARVAFALDWLATHRGWLLIVDNVDDEDAAVALSGYFGQLTRGHVLITSRLQNWTDNVQALNIEVLSLDDSMELLCKLTDKKRRRADDDAAQVLRLAQLMEGLPLALHQAAGYINEQRLTFAEYHVRYDEEAATLLDWFNKLTIPYAGPDELARRPVLVTWKTSFDKLDRITRFWLLVFSHFAPDPIPEFLLDSAPDSTDEVKTRHRAAKRALAQAETYSLLTRHDDPPRFKLHRLVQHIILLTSSEQDKSAALDVGIQLIRECNPGNPSDVRSWPCWNPLQAHAAALVNHASDIPAPKDLSWLLSALALLLNTKSMHVQAEPHIRRALKLDEAHYGSDNPHVAIRLNNLVSLLQDTNRLAEAEPLMRRALQINEASFGPDHPSVAGCLNNLASLLKITYRLEEAEPLIRRALKIDEAAFGPKHPDVARDLSNLTTLLQATNRLTEAEPLIRRALDIDEDSYGLDHPLVAVRLNNLASLLQDMNRLAEAEPLLRRALGIDEASYGSGHPTLATELNNLAQILQATNRPEEAESLMRRVLDILDNGGGDPLPNYASALSNLARLIQSRHRFAEAEPLMRRAWEIDEASLGPDHPNVAIRLNNLAALLHVTNRWAEAYPLLHRALGILVSRLGLEHPNSQKVLRSFITLLQDMEVAEAEIQQRVQAAIEGR